MNFAVLTKLTKLKSNSNKPSTKSNNKNKTTLVVTI